MIIYFIFVYISGINLAECPDDNASKGSSFNQKSIYFVLFTTGFEPFSLENWSPPKNW